MENEYQVLAKELTKELSLFGVGFILTGNFMVRVLRRAGLTLVKVQK